MAELFVSPIVDKVLSKLGSAAYQQLCLACSVNDDINELADTLNTIKTVLSDAEEQQANKPGLTLWLGKLKEVCYDAEDVLDEIEAESLRKQAIAKHGTITTKVRNFFSSPKSVAFRFKVGHKIKEIRERLDKIAVEKTNYNLAVQTTDNKKIPVRGRETHSFVSASDVIGRDEDREEIIKLIMSPTDDENISVHTIVGIGGLGKTTLAKLVYNDERVDQHFDLKIWACVPGDFDLEQLLKKILKSATKQKYSESDVNQLQGELRGILEGKKYLLVLDDVWSESRERWIELRSLLMGGAPGSIVMVTTRSHKVASVMGTMPNFNLRGLSHEECSSLFIKCAFEKGQQEEYPALITIGEEIVRKCGGIPLAVRTLGSLLFSSRDEQYWTNVRDDEIWKLPQEQNDILNALKVSYDNLPSYLKPCFAYCSMFPKDYEFSNIMLIQFWMAHGLLQSLDENQELENIGHQYLKELTSRSFFQDFQDFDEVMYDIIYSFKMHDLIHDLATSLMQSEHVSVISRSQPIPKAIRHLTFASADVEELDLSTSLPACRVRTFMTMEETSQSLSVGSLIPSLEHLRILSLNGKMQVLPKEYIGNLKHLRYLDLGKNYKIKKLPNSICKVHGLQTLLIGDCKQLEELPRDIRYLINLRVLILTTRQRYLPKNGIGHLHSLRFLAIVECENLEYMFEDIDGLKALRTLWIFDCPKLMSLPHNMKNLSRLENLILADCESLALNRSEESERQDNHQDLSSARPPLRMLLIHGLPNLVELPQWLLQGTLKILHIEDCSDFKALPESIQDLKSLQLLHIEDCPELSTLPENACRLPALRKLTIEGCPKLIERCELEKGEDWSKIAHIPNIEFDGEIIKPNN